MWCDLSNLLAAFGRVQRGSEVPGVDKMRLEDLAADLDRHMEALHAALTAGTWQPSPLLRLGLRKEDGSRRILGLPTVQDRVVIEALRAVLEHRIEARLHPAAYAFRHRRSAHRAVGTLQRQLEGGHSWVALTDIASFFDAIPLEGMLEATATLLADAPDGASIQQTLRALLQGHQLRPGRGLAQGSALSPALSNLYLTPLDAQLTDQGLHLVRYCDNLAFSAATEAEAQRALRAARGLLTGLKLTVKDAKTGIYSAEQGFPWLGFWITASGRTISIGAVEALRERVQRAAAGATQAQLRDRLLPVVRGWLQYYDAPLPAQADLGVHTATLRDLIAFVRGEAPPEEPLGDEEDEAPLEPLPTGRAAALLDEVDRLTTQGRFAEASQRYEAAMRLLALEALEAEATPEAPPEDAPLDPDDERLDAFIGLFLAGGAAASALELPATRQVYEPLGRPVQAQDVAAHLAGRRSLAVQPRLEEGDALLGAIDIDATRPEAALGARAFAEVLALVARHLGWTVLLEDTGGRGFHLWFPLQRPVAAHALHRALAQLITRAAEPAEGVSFEILPGRDDAPETHAQTLVLPLGVHRSTGRRSALLAPTVLGPELEGLFELLPGELPASVGAAAVMPEAALQRGLGVDAPLPSWASFGAPVARLMEGCALLRHLAEKAVELGHLNHAERLSLLYSLGHLGPQGERALHAIISRCANYDVIETNRQIQRLTGLPIGCSRLREKHLTPALEPACRCDFGEAGRRGGYPTPLLHTSGFRRAWREALRERAERRRGDPNAPPPTAPVTRDEPPAAAAIPVDGLEVPEEPLRLATPPHTWA